MSQPSSSWTNSLSKAAWTLLIAAIAVSVAWHLLEPLVVPLVVIVVLLGIVRVAFGVRRRDRW